MKKGRLVLVSVGILSVVNFHFALHASQSWVDSEAGTLRRTLSAPLISVNASINQGPGDNGSSNSGGGSSKGRILGGLVFLGGAAAIGVGCYYVGRATGELKDGCAKMDAHCTVLQAQCEQALSLAKWAIGKCLHANTTG